MEHTEYYDDSEAASSATGMQTPESTPSASIDGQPPAGSAASTTSSSHASFPPIAIVGMGMRLPGGIHDAEAYWDLLVNGRTTRTPIPRSRFDVDAWHNVASRHGHFLADETLRRLDAGFFSSLSRQEAEMMDPRQRLLLEVVHEAFETAGETRFRGADVGVYVGQMGDEWDNMAMLDRQRARSVRPEVSGDYIAANRVSYEFDLRGPSMVVRTACSSSLVALHLACQDINSGNCSAAIVAGVNLALSPSEWSVMTEHGVLSPSGECRSFDAAGDGFLRGEAVSAIYIKPLAAAVRDGDPVRAVVRGTCASNDGRGVAGGITVPDSASQERTMRRAYAMAGIHDLESTAMVECHATGTKVGDPLEAAAVAQIWGEKGIIIGSVKPNLGHGEGASGISSIIKMVLALEARKIPPNINFETPNPLIPWKAAKLTVPTQALEWPADRKERVSINSFGIAGTNAHVILESAACAGVGDYCQRSPGSSESNTPRLLAFSAKHPVSLRNVVDATKTYINTRGASLTDVAHTLCLGRIPHGHRAFSVVGQERPDAGGLEVTYQAQDASGALPTASMETPRVVWVFTGQGAQWAQMGAELVDKEPVVRRRIDHLESTNRKGELSKPKSESRLSEAQFSQPVLAALQIALVDLLRSWDVQPSAVVGHSSGETPAAYAAGALTAEDAFLLAYHRGAFKPLLRAAHSGGMAAVGLGRTDIERGGFLRPGVIVACDNSPSSVTLSGEAHVLPAVMADIAARAPPGVLCRRLDVESAYHYADHMWTVMPEFAAGVGGVDGIRSAYRPLQVPMYSSVTAGRIDQVSTAYYIRNMVSPVLFDGAVRALLRDFGTATPPIFVEVGPHSAFAGPIRQILQSEPARGATARYIPTLIRHRHDATALLRETAGNLWLAGVDVDLAAVNPAGRRLADLPTYKWHYEPGREYWTEARMSRDLRRAGEGHHEILGGRVVETGDACPSWRCRLQVEDVPWLRDHVVAGEAVFPAAAYVVMAGEALRRLAGAAGAGQGVSMQGVHFVEPLVLSGESVEVVTALMPVDLRVSSSVADKWFSFSISSLGCNGSQWVTHATGRCRMGCATDASSTEHIQASEQQLPRAVDPHGFYQTWKRYGLEYGPMFQRLMRASSEVGEMRATGTINTWCAPEERKLYYPAIHPTVLDSGLHVSIVAACRGLQRNFDSVAVPKSIEELYIGVCDDQADLYVTAECHSGSYQTSHVTGVCNDKVAFHIRGLEVAPMSFGTSLGDQDPHAGHVLEWKADVDLFRAGLGQPDKTENETSIGLGELLDLLGHKNPNMTILEIRPGAESRNTAKILSILGSGTQARRYGTYIIACATEEALTATKGSVQGEVPGLQFARVDLSQGSWPEDTLKHLSCDLVIVDPLAITSISSEAANGQLDVLENIKRLLRPGGHLLVHESSGSSEGNGPATSCYGSRLYDRNLLNEKVWSELQASTRCNLSADTDHKPQSDKITIATSPLPQDKQGPKKRLSILAHDTSHPTVVAAAQHVAAIGNDSLGYHLDWFSPGQLLPTCQPVVSLLDLEEQSFFDEMTADKWAMIKTSILSLQDTVGGEAAKMLWVTGLSQIDCVDPQYSLALGFLRSARRETGADIVTVELESFGDEGWHAVAKVLDHRFGTSTQAAATPVAEAVDLDCEYVFCRGEIKIPRFRRVVISHELAIKPDCETNHNKELSPERRDISEVIDKSILPAPAPHGSGQTRRQASIRPDRTYVIVGGLGGLGLSSARLLTERGARHVVFFSRSAESYLASHPEILTEFTAMRCRIHAISGSVDSPEDVDAMVATASQPPIGGVIHSAMVLQDEALADMTFAQWRAVLDPKVKGVRNLHAALAAHQRRSGQAPPDFFVLFSSLNGLGGQARQANYAAANGFLDAFAQFRRGRGHACSVVDIGLVEDVGVLSRDARRLAALHAGALHCLRERELLDALELAVLRSSSSSVVNGGRRGSFVSAAQVAIGLGSVASLRRAADRSGWTRDPRLLVHHVGASKAAAESDGDDDDSGRLRGLLQCCAQGDVPISVAEEAASLLARQIAVILGGFLMQGESGAVDVDASMRRLGVDSLVSIELRNLLRRKFGLAGLQVQDVRDSATPTELAKLAIERMLLAVGENPRSRMPAGVPPV
ncbi:Type I Iterative PKS [Pyricularia oryzae]|nr:Type I Iterative PKS [Pyricularia oryzae]KAI6580655.1 Type I Iterative PKS [Pyricularia oryzae]